MKKRNTCFACREMLKEAVSLFLRLLLIPMFIRKTISRKMATIIFYHNVNAETFKTHLNYLVKHYHVISLDRLVSALTSRDDESWDGLPRNSLVVTMDDGFAGNHSLAPVLRDFKMPLTIFLRPDGIRGHSGYLNKEAIGELSACGASFGAHSLTHVSLPRLADRDAHDEIIGSKEFLDKELSAAIKHFAYPYGDYGDRELDILGSSGYYESARTTKPGSIGRRTNPYELPCMGIGDDAGINKMILDAVGVF